MKFSIKDFFSKCAQIRSFVQCLSFTYLSEKTFLEKKSQLFRHFSPTTTFPDKIFYQTNTFLQSKVKVELDDKFLERDFNS